jgi:hypothetical protein
MELNHISGEIVQAAIKVHSALGPGLLGSAYRACLSHELARRGLRYEVERVLPVKYDGLAIDVGYRLDLLRECRNRGTQNGDQAVARTSGTASFLPTNERATPGLADQFQRLPVARRSEANGGVKNPGAASPVLPVVQGLVLPGIREA